jgi:putative hemolysin
VVSLPPAVHEGGPVSGTFRDIALIFGFILLGGLFVLAEMALVSLRDSQAKGLATRGRRGAAVGKLNRDPNRFLAASQVGVTLCGFLSAAFGGATLADRLAPAFRDWGMSSGVADAVALISITLVISYFSLVFGELVPKRFALQRAESISLTVAPTLDRIATIVRPVIWLLSMSTNIVVRLLGGDPRAKREQITDAEIRELVSGSDTLSEEERQIVEDVFGAGDRQIREVMIPRTEVDFISAQTPAYKAAQLALEQPHSRYPVIGDSSDDVLGFVHVRDLFDPHLAGRSVRVGEITREVLMLPATRKLLSALTDMRREGAHLAIVVDEYGGTAGIVTLEDLVEEIIGDIKDEYDVDEPETTHFLTGELEVDGLLNLDDFEDETGIVLPEGPYETVAGYIVQQLGHVPLVDESVTYDGFRLTVVELDGKRISRVKVEAIHSSASGRGDQAAAHPPTHQIPQSTPESARDEDVAARSSSNGVAAPHATGLPGVQPHASSGVSSDNDSS